MSECNNCDDCSCGDAVEEPAFSFGPEVNLLPPSSRGEIWLRVWTALVMTDGLNTSAEVTEWADNCLNDYAIRFLQPINVVQIKKEPVKGKVVTFPNSLDK